MEMLVRVDVIELEAGRAESLELGADFRPHLPLHLGQKKHRRAGKRHVRPKPPRSSTRSGTAEGGSTGVASVSARCRPTASRGSRRAIPTARRRRRRSDHQARGGEDAFDMRGLDGPVDLVGKAEIVRRDDRDISVRGLVPVAQETEKLHALAEAPFHHVGTALTISPMI